MRLLLASKSPRRRQLLGELGYPLEFVSIDVDEQVPAGTAAAQVAELLARRKANAFPIAQIGKDDLLITADTVVVHRDEVLGKPHDRNQAIAMLQGLVGDSHSVYTGVCMRSCKETVSFTEKTDVHFRHLTDDEVAYYVDHYRPYDKAGAYGIQEWIGMVAAIRIEGCYYNVMGLPVARVYETLRQMGFCLPTGPSSQV